MSKDWFHGEVLRAVFPLLDGKELASCMLVCRQWREIAGEDYFWKCICVKRWPSICKRPLPVGSYHKFFLTFSRPQLPQPILPQRLFPTSRPQRPQPLLPPRLSLTDLEFYIDIWSRGKLIFSEAISGCVFQTGIKNPPAGIPDILKLHLDGPDYKMIAPVEPRLTIALGSMISVSVLASRKDTNQVACIVRDSEFYAVDDGATRALARALAFAYPNFSPRCPFTSEIRACVSLLLMRDGNVYATGVFGIEISFVGALGIVIGGFVGAARKEEEVLWYLDMLDWE